MVVVDLTRLCTFWSRLPSSIWEPSCWQAFKARDIELEFSESSLHATTPSHAVVIVIVRDMPRAFYLVLTFTIFGCCVACLLLIFLPKMYMQYVRYGDHSSTQQRKAVASSLRKSAERIRDRPRAVWDNASKAFRTIDAHVPSATALSSTEVSEMNERRGMARSNSF